MDKPFYIDEENITREELLELVYEWMDVALDYDEMVCELQVEIDGLKQEIDELKFEIEQVNEEIDELEKENAELRYELDNQPMPWYEYYERNREYREL